MGIVDEIKYTFKNGSNLTRLLYINIGMFLFIRVSYAILWVIGVDVSTPFIREWLSLPSSVPELMRQPWSIITYMFLHFDFIHIIFNLLMLFWFGKIFLQYFDQKKLLSVYILGGIAGGVLYMLSYNVSPVLQEYVNGSYLLGASAGVIAVLLAVAVYVPNYVVNLMFIGPVRIKYIALFSILVYTIQIMSINSGGNIAHLGGALWGYLYISQLRKGNDWANWFDQLIEKLGNIFKPKSKIKVSYRRSGNMEYDYNAEKKIKQEEIDVILDKIRKSGYESLSKEEKAKLFNANKNNQTN